MDPLEERDIRMAELALDWAVCAVAQIATEWGWFEPAAYANMPDGSGTPIFDEMIAARPQFRHASGQECHGCQICLAEAWDDEADDADGMRGGGGR